MMGKNGKRTGLAIAMAALALALAVPASASADKTVIGRQQLSGGTISFSGLCGVPPCTTAQHSVPSASVFVVTSPVNGTVTSWRFRTPAGGTMGEIYALRVLRSAANGTFTSVATSNNYTLPDTNDAVRGPFTTSIPIKKGDRIALRTLGPADQVPMFSAPGSMYYVFAKGTTPPTSDLADGGPPGAPQQDNPGSQVAIQATITFTNPPPGCPPNCPPPPPPPLSAGKPVLSALSVSPKTFRAASRGGSIARTRRPPIGTRISYRLSQTATTKFTLERRTKGRSVNGRCVAQTRRNRTRRACTRYVKVSGSFSRLGAAGANSFRFTGRMRGRKLAPASYRLTGVAANSNGRSSSRTATFKIVK